MTLNLDIDSNKKFKKGLYLVSTPIGNLQDITLRAIQVLKNSDYILCEDTRNSKKLLKNYSIHSKLVSYHKFNERRMLSKIIEILNKGSIVSLISDAGMPTISDPGNILIDECNKNNIDVIPLPGPSAVISAVSISGFSNRFIFYGFFPEKEKNIKKDLKFLSQLDTSIVFFISAKKINKAIPQIKKNFTGRKIIICREISKMYEEFIRTDIKTIKEFRNDIKGEITIVISEKSNNKNTSQKLSESDKDNIKGVINKLSIKEIVTFMCKDNKIPKKDVYNYCLSLKKNEK